MLEISPPSTPASSAPLPPPSTFIAAYAARLMPTISTTISQILYGLSTSNGPSVATISPPGAVAAIGGLPRIRQLGLTVTWVLGSVPTTVTYERSITPPNSGNGTGCPAPQLMTR